MLFYHLRNWEKFQHYKDRNPPWIKIHFEILSSQDWVNLNDASRVLAIACMLIASRNEGRVPADPHYIKRVAYLNSLPKFKPLLDCGFLEILQADASTLQADASTLQADARPETYSEYSKETETERKKRARKNSRACSLSPEFLEFWETYPKNGGSRKEAAKSYDKARRGGASHVEIMAGLMLYKPFLERTGTPEAHATTWLNQERWTINYSELSVKSQNGIGPPGKNPYRGSVDVQAVWNEMVEEEKAKNVQ